MSKRFSEISATTNTSHQSVKRGSTSAAAALGPTSQAVGNELLARMKKIEEFLQSVDTIFPHLVELRSCGQNKLSRKEAVTLEHIFALIDQSQAYRTEYFRIAQKLQAIHHSIGHEEIALHSQTDSAIQRERDQTPEKRLAALRKAIEVKYAQAIASPVAHRIRYCEDEIKESCARLLSEDIAGAASILNKQRVEWSVAVSKAEFGFPGFRSRIKALRCYWKSRNMKRELEAEELKTAALYENYRKHREGVAFLASAVMSYFKIFDSSGSSSSKRFEKMWRLDCEKEIQAGIQKRGQSLTQSLRQEKFLCEEKLAYCSQARNFIRGRGAYHNDLRTRYEQAKLHSANSAIERAFHSSFALCVESLAVVALQLKESCQFLSHELQFQRNALLNRLSKAIRAIDMESEGIREIRSYDQGFVIPPKEVIKRN